MSNHLAVPLRVGLALLLGGCGIHHRPKAQFSGSLTSDNTSCPASNGTLVIQNEEIVFSPADATWTLHGKTQNGEISAARERPGFDHKTYKTTLSLKLFDDRATGTYTTPSCNYAVALKRF